MSITVSFDDKPLEELLDVVLFEANVNPRVTTLIVTVLDEAGEERVFYRQISKDDDVKIPICYIDTEKWRELS